MILFSFSPRSHADMGERRRQDEQHGFRRSHRQLGPRRIRIHGRFHHRTVGRHNRRQSRTFEKLTAYVQSSSYVSTFILYIYTDILLCYNIV